MLSFKNNYIHDEKEEIAGLVDRYPVVTGDERYIVYLKNLFDYMSADQIKSYIQAANAMETQTIVQAQMKKSLIEQLKSKLHDCLMATDLSYRYEFETSQMRKQIQQLEQWIDEERKRRWKAESEVHELKMALKESEEDTEYQD